MKHLASNLVERFHRVLVEEIQRTAPSYLSASFTVAEIYQTLVPYRTHRDRIGVEMNGDYEDALLRLLSGEGQLLVLESDSATEQIQRELRTTNPNTGLYREFAALGVRLNPETLPDDLPLPGEETVASLFEESMEPEGEEDTDPLAGAMYLVEDDPPEESSNEEAPVETDISWDEEPETQAAPAVTFELDAPPAQTPALTPSPAPEETPMDDDFVALVRGGGDGPTPSAPPPSECPDCTRSLPAREGLRFCPFCGTNVFVTACGECGEVLERDWAFCVACGTSTS